MPVRTCSRSGGRSWSLGHGNSAMHLAMSLNCPGWHDSKGHRGVLTDGAPTRDGREDVTDPKQLRGRASGKSVKKRD